MSTDEIKVEIRRIEKALTATTSDYLRRDYGKYLKRLNRQLVQIERCRKK